MPLLTGWRVLRDFEGNNFLAGNCKGHPYIENGPIITNEVKASDCHQGAIVISKSGTKYELEAPMPDGEYPEFAFGLIMKRALDRASRKGISFAEEDLQALGRLVNRIIRGES